MTGTPTEVPVPRRVAVVVWLFTAGNAVDESRCKALSSEDEKLAIAKINVCCGVHQDELHGNRGFVGLDPEIEALLVEFFHMPEAWRLNRGEMIA